MSQTRFLYTFNYDFHHAELCKLESRQIFNSEETDRLIFSNVDADPSISPFIKNRIEITSLSNNYDDFLSKIKEENILTEDFKIEYVRLEGDSRTSEERHEKLTDVGYCMVGESNFKQPTVTYAICNYKDYWYFGVYTKHDHDWHKHKKKPRTFSSSINIDIAKTLISVAAKGDKTKQLLDACCGVGTVLLEACCAGFNLEGCDINFKACNNSRENLQFFNYSTTVFCSDIKDLNKQYDSIIIDLPYNLYTYSNDEIVLNIIKSASKLAPRIVVVSISDIETFINQSGLRVVDYCTVGKRGKSKFERRIWVCERVNRSDVHI